MDLQTTWFILLAVLIAGYAVLDGFDLGVGILHLFARDDTERRVHMNAIGPVWDGNEVWLLTAGGALFAAFPAVYATVFSGFYLALVLLLLALILRAVSMEFRGQFDNPTWRRSWDISFGIGSFLPTLLFGVAVGNILRGIPLAEDGSFTGSFFGLLNPYSVLIGLLTVAMMLMHGALYMAMKTENELRERMHRLVSKLWIAFVLLYVLATIYTIFTAAFLFEDIFSKSLFWVFLLGLLAAIVYIPVATQSRKYFGAFLASSVTIISMIGLAAVSLFPRLVPSITHLDYSLTAYNASSTPHSLKVMLIIALVGMPIVLAYTIIIYRIFKGKVVLSDHSY